MSKDTLGNMVQGIFLGPAGDPNVNPKSKNWFKKPGASGKGADQALANAALQILNMSRETRDLYFSQLYEGLTTGKVAARLPEVQAATEGALQAGSQESNALRDALGTGNLNRTPFGVGQRAQTELSNRQRVGTTEADVINSLLLAAPNSALAQSQQTGLQGLGTLSGIATQRRIQNLAQNANVYQALGQGIGGIAGMGGIAYADYRSQQPTTRPPYIGAT